MSSKAAEKKPAPEKLVFVNYDARHMELQPHRGASKHSQKVFQTRRLREAIRILQLSKGDDQKTNGTPPHSQPHNRVHSDSTSNRITNSTTTTLPLMLKKGNSDPFDTLPIPINPAINRVIAFTRDFVFPTLFPPEPRSTTPTGDLERTWSTSAAILHDDCAAWASLSLMATNFRNFNRSPAADALVAQMATFRQRTMVALRKRLAEPAWASASGGVGGGFGVGDEEMVARAVYSLMVAEMAALNMPAAAVHAKALSQMIARGGSASQQTDLWILENGINADVPRAVACGTRTFFDFPEWILEPLSVEWGHLFNPPLVRGQSSFNAAVDDKRLLALLEDLKEAHDADQALTLKDAVVGDGVFRAMRLRNLICQARLHNYYLDRNEETTTLSPNSLSPNSTTNPSRTNTTATSSTTPNLTASLNRLLSISALIWSCYNDRTKFTAEHLKPVLLANLHNSSSPLSHTYIYAPLKLWILYVGALAERGLIPEGVADTAAFNTLFVRQALEMKIATWGGVREVLKGFLYSDSTVPHGSEWFWRAFAVDVDGSGVEGQE